MYCSTFTWSDDVVLQLKYVKKQKNNKIHVSSEEYSSVKSKEQKCMRR